MRSNRGRKEPEQRRTGRWRHGLDGNGVRAGCEGAAGSHVVQAVAEDFRAELGLQANIDKYRPIVHRRHSSPRRRSTSSGSKFVIQIANDQVDQHFVGGQAALIRGRLVQMRRSYSFADFSGGQLILHAAPQGIVNPSQGDIDGMHFAFNRDATSMPDRPST